MTADRLFSGGGIGQGMGTTDLVQRAVETPLPVFDQIGSSFRQQFVENIGIGTVVRELTTPDLVRLPPELPRKRTGRGTNRQIDNVTTMPTGKPTLAERQKFLERAGPQGTMTETEYRASRHFRENIPWKAGMTEERAEALAEQDDLRRLNEFYEEKRPVVALLGRLAGGFTDPINYVPVFGQSTFAAAAARMGPVVGRALTASADAAINTAIASVATAPLRQEYGDDTSFETFATDVAMAAFVGSVFGTAAGVIGKAVDPRAQLTARGQLNNAENVQKAGATMNDAVHGLVHNDRVDIRPASRELMDEAVDTALKARAPVSPAEAIDVEARAAAPEVFDRLAVVSRQIEINQRQLAQYDAEVQSPEAAQLRRDLAKIEQLDERAKSLRRQAATAKNPAKQAEFEIRADRVDQQKRDLMSKITPDEVDRLEFNEIGARNFRQSINTLETERAELQTRAEGARTQAREGYWQRVAEDPENAEARAAAYQLLPDAPVQSPRVNTPSASTDPTRAPSERVRAAETGEPAPQVDPVTPETGAGAGSSRGVEVDGTHDLEDQIEVLRSQGRIPEDLEAELTAANDDFDRTNRYADAMQRAVACLFL